MELNNFWILFILSAASCSIGFIVFLWFISVGYGVAIAVLGIAMLIIYYKGLTLGTIFLCSCLIIYGIRLAGYLLVRELKTSYKKVMAKDIKQGSEVPIFVQFLIWITCAFLYVLMVSPTFFRLDNNSGTDICTYVGAGICFFGIILESAADIQKFKAKKKNPKSIVTTGLFKIVRCPNYLGECICWTGIFVSGFTTLHGFWQWTASIVGWVAIIWIMFGGCRRLEIRQNKQHKDEELYQKYYKSTPIILPGIPLYSVEKYWWLVG